MTVHKLEFSFDQAGKADRGIVSLANDAVNWMAGLWTAIQARRSINRLLKWDDRMLSDIGVTRGDVVSAVSGSITENPGMRLSRLASERRIANEQRLAAARRHRRAALRDLAGRQ